MVVAVLFGVFGSAALGMLFLSRGRSASVPNVELGLFLLFSATIFTLIALTHSTVVTRPDRIELFEHSLSLAIGPLLLALIVKATGERGARSIPLWNFLPAAFAFLYAVLALFLPLVDVLGSVPIILHLVFYSSIATMVLVRRRQIVSWPSAFVAAMWVIHGAQFIRLAFPQAAALRDIVAVTGTLALNIFVVAALYYSTILQRWLPARKYAKSGVSESELETMKNELLRLLETCALHRHRKLSLADVAKRMGWSEYATSQVINDGLNCTFAELIRKYRLRDAKSLLADAGNARVSVESIGLEAGFGSRAAFYKAFTESEGISPSAFRERIRSERNRHRGLENQ